MENKIKNRTKKIWILIILVIMVSIALVWIFEKGEVLGASVAR